ncbi:hypothetical protein BDN71DRAFT_1495213 [Pleurotus eryngii]|uniref:F-box domain-containing protein n=1 Tax=Pleurotus eryngii TaxID=5323 RepID=A0A9P6D9U4_PLEER|nr:hypothetical protein BDN71DRAFT_1495213 [Pleurotus eryngii]
MTPPIAGYIPPEGTLTKHQYAYFFYLHIYWVCHFQATQSQRRGARCVIVFQDKTQRSREEDGVRHNEDSLPVGELRQDDESNYLLRNYRKTRTPNHWRASARSKRSLARCKAGRTPAGYLLFGTRKSGEKIDLPPFWDHQPDAPSMGSNVFDWTRLKAGSYKWLLNRPDIPKVRGRVGDDDTLSHCPLELLYLLLPYLSPRSYAMLASTSCLFRYHALTIFQPYTRDLVIALRWAIPTRREYEVAPEEVRGIMASEDATLSPIDGDWFGYLPKVHKSKGMRVRRWIWGECEEVKKVYEERLLGSPYAITAGEGQTDIAEKLGEKVGMMLRLLPE